MRLSASLMRRTVPNARPYPAPSSWLRKRGASAERGALARLCLVTCTSHSTPQGLIQKTQRILIASLILFQGCCDQGGWEEGSHEGEL